MRPSAGTDPSGIWPGGWLPEGSLSGKAGVTMKIYPDLNHLFASGEGTVTPSEYTSEIKHVAPEVIEDLVRWVFGGIAPKS
jgi:hypothetical protein